MDNYKTDLTFKDVDEGWATNRLGDVVSFKVTNSFSRENLNYENGRVKNIHYGDIHTKFQTLFDIEKENVPFINSEIDISKIKEESYCQEGDLILADASEDLADVGKSIEIINLNNEKLVSGLHTILARPAKELFPKGYIGYFFQSSFIRKQIQKESHGTKVLSISPTRLQSLIINYPLSIIHSTKIASCLSSLDDLIYAHSQKLELLKDLKKGLMQNLFPQEGEKVPKYRFKEFEKDGDPIAIGWVEIPINKLVPQNEKYGIVDGPFGSNLKTIHYKTEGIPIITSGYVTDGVFKAECYLYVTEEKFKEEKRSAVKPGDIVMAKIGARCGASAIIPKNHRVGILSGNALKITIDESRHSTNFIWQQLWYLHSNNKFDGIKSIGAQPAISMDSLKKFELIIPLRIKEQQKIATCLSSLDELIKCQSEKIEQLKLHKKGLM